MKYSLYFTCEESQTSKRFDIVGGWSNFTSSCSPQSCHKGVFPSLPPHLTFCALQCAFMLLNSGYYSWGRHINEESHSKSVSKIRSLVKEYDEFNETLCEQLVQFSSFLLLRHFAWFCQDLLVIIVTAPQPPTYKHSDCQYTVSILTVNSDLLFSGHHLLFFQFSPSLQ